MLQQLSDYGAIARRAKRYMSNTLADDALPSPGIVGGLHPKGITDIGAIPLPQGVLSGLPGGVRELPNFDRTDLKINYGAAGPPSLDYRVNIGLPAPETGTSGSTATAATTPPIESPVTSTAATTASPAKPSLAKNPQLSPHPLGAKTDSQFEAEDAQLQFDITNRYNDVLRQLGFMDPESGQRVQGTVEIAADRMRRDLNRERGLAAQEVTNENQQRGTLFSGVRGTQQARRTHPFVTALGDLDVDTAGTLSGLYDQGTSLLTEYGLRRNALLAAAAARAAKGITTNPPPTPGTPTAASPADAPTAVGPEGGRVETPQGTVLVPPASGAMLPMPETTGVPEGMNTQAWQDYLAPVAEVDPYTAQEYDPRAPARERRWIVDPTTGVVKLG